MTNSYNVIVSLAATCGNECRVAHIL